MATSTVLTNKPINPRGDDNRPVDSYNRAALYSGKALDFGGVNDVIELDGYTTFTGDFSLSMYIKTSNIAQKGLLCDSANNDGLLLYTTDEELAIRIDGINHIWNTGLPIYNDHMNHLVVVRSGAEVTPYLNGVVGNSVTATSGTFAFNQFGRQTSTANYFLGQASNIKAFNVALTAAQVADLYNNPEKIVPTGVSNDALKLWLPMMEGAGTTVYDGSGNGNHGTISGATWAHGIGAPVAQTAVIDWNKGVNLVKYSEEFNESSYWNPLQSTITANDTTAPDGQTTADKILASATNGNHQVDGTFFSIVSGAITSSIYAKKGNTDFVRLRHNSTTQQIRAWFDLENGEVGSVDHPGSATIEDVGNGWYRCTMTESGNTKTGLASLQIFINESDGQTTWAADGDEYIYLWGASSEQASSAGPYIPTLSTAQTSPVLLPQGLTTGRDITGVNLFENVRKQGALNLDGNSWAEVHDNASVDLTTGITLECWFYKDDQTTQSGLLGKWGSTTGVDRCYMLMIGSDNRIRFYTNTDSGIDPSALSNGWNHIVGTYDKTTPIRKLYVNAIEKDSDAFASDLTTSDKPVEIGRYNYTTTYQLPNQIAQPRIYNRALTASEVLNNYNATKTQYQ